MIMSEDNTEHTESQTPQVDTQEMLKALPESLQQSIKSFQTSLVRSIIAQQTNLNGDKVEIKVTPDRADWYKERLSKVLESGFLNPHIYPPVEIKDK